MVSKTLTITEEAYSVLKSLKREGESFSKLFIRLAEKNVDGSKYFGILKGDVKEARKSVKKVREGVSKGFGERRNVFTRHVRRN